MLWRVVLFKSGVDGELDALPLAKLGGMSVGSGMLTSYFLIFFCTICFLAVSMPTFTSKYKSILILQRFSLQKFLVPFQVFMIFPMFCILASCLQIFAESFQNSQEEAYFLKMSSRFRQKFTECSQTFAEYKGF